MSSAPATPQTGERSFLERSLVWWHAIFWIVLGIVAVGGTLNDDVPLRNKVIALALLAVIGAAYRLVGGCALMGGGGLTLRAALIYVSVLLAATLTVAQLNDIGHLLLFVVFAHTWAILPTRVAIIFSCVVTAGLVLTAVAAAGWTRDAWFTGLSIGGSTIVAGVLMGFWITGIVSESEKRKYLIAELERTRAELGSVERRSGAFEERERLAAEIHDTLAQGFMSILVQSRAVQPADARDVEKRLAQIERTARDNLAEARGLIEALQPADLRDHSLADACRRVVDRFAEETGVHAGFEIHGEPRPLSANAEVVLLRATQEALTNVRKHAGATTVRTVLAYGIDSTTIEVADDGHGFSPDSSTGFGLHGMRTRVEQVDGTLSVSSDAGHGTTIGVEVPS